MPRKQVSYADKIFFVSEEDPTRRLTHLEAAAVIQARAIQLQLDKEIPGGYKGDIVVLPERAKKK